MKLKALFTKRISSQELILSIKVKVSYNKKSTVNSHTVSTGLSILSFCYNVIIYCIFHLKQVTEKVNFSKVPWHSKEYHKVCEAEHNSHSGGSEWHKWGIQKQKE